MNKEIEQAIVQEVGKHQHPVRNFQAFYQGADGVWIEVFPLRASAYATEKTALNAIVSFTDKIKIHNPRVRQLDFLSYKVRDNGTKTKTEQYFTHYRATKKPYASHREAI